MMQEKLGWCDCCGTSFCECFCHERTEQQRKLRTLLRHALNNVDNITKGRAYAELILVNLEEAMSIAKEFQKLHMRKVIVEK